MTENKRDLEGLPVRPGEESPLRFAEGCLYNYPKDLARLERLRSDLEKLSSRAVTNYEAEGRSAGGHSDPVLSCVQRREALEGEIASLERRTGPVTRLMADLEGPNVPELSPRSELARVARLHYFGKRSKGQTADELNMSRSSFYRRRRELIDMAAYYLGF